MKSLTLPMVTGSRTREMVYARTHELARLAGRSPHAIRQVDFERAKREVTGESDSARQDAVLDGRSDFTRESFA